MTGMSNGAGMTSAAACHLADIVAAFAPVAGVHGPDTCAPGGPAAALIAFHGTDDPFLKTFGEGVVQLAGRAVEVTQHG